VAGVESVITAAQPRMMQSVPMIPMRIAALNGRPSQDILNDTGRIGIEPGMLRREYRSTFRDTIVSSEILKQGRFWRGTGEGLADSTGTLVYPISISEDMARSLDAGLGDRIAWDVQGARIETRVTSVREVDWARLEPNFFVVFSSASLKEAPATWIVMTRMDDAARRATLQRAVAERYPNAVAFDITVIQATIERIFGRVAVAVRFMAVFSLATGALVLLGAVAAGRLQRIREGALLKTLGATRRQISRIFLTEYLALGLLSSVVGIGLASAGAWAFTKFAMELPFALPAVPLLGVLIATAALVTIVGLTASREVFRRTAMEVLREN
jgi:putative ABC transport system permease protein